jgi:transglutaminase-like putative cysteine protease
LYPVTFSNQNDDFRELDSIDLALDDSFYLLRENMARSEITKSLPEFEIRGAATSGDPLPLPGNTSTLQDFLFDGVDINPLGTVRIFPNKSIIQGNVRWNDDLTTEAPPFPDEDLAIDEYEIEAIHEVADALGLKQLATTTEKIQRLKKFFDTEFEYTLYLSIGRAYSSQSRPSAIETFLTTNKRGHCEYFATATTLLLRAADVPARYTIGFSVMEKNSDENEWVIRGTHAHAWTRVWNEELQRWIDFDPTPSGWLAAETHGTSRYQSFLDIYQRIKEDFFLWRNQPKNRLGVTIVMWILGVIFITYIAIRLKKSRVVIRSQKFASVSGQPTIKTPLHLLEKTAFKILGPRNRGETWVTWLMKLKTHQISEADLETACSLHQQLRFDPSTPNSQISQQLTEITQKLNHQLTKS